MARVIYIVNATQVVVSENHPEGLFSVMSGYPKTYDSRTAGEDKAFTAAEAEYLGKLSSILAADNPNRAMATVTLERSDGRSIYHRCIGAFPAEPQPEPEEEAEQE